MVAITTANSPLHTAAGSIAPAHSLKANRKQQLEAVLRSVGLGWLPLLLQQAGTHTLNRLVTKYSLQELEKIVLRESWSERSDRSCSRSGS